MVAIRRSKSTTKRLLTRCEENKDKNNDAEANFTKRAEQMEKLTTKKAEKEKKLNDKTSKMFEGAKK